MKTSRPKIKVPMDMLDYVLILASIAVLILMWGHLIMEYSGLPETVASHYNGSGEPDGYSSKTYLWFMPCLATIMFIGLFILSRFPHIHNYMVNITEENALKQYGFSVKVLGIVNFLCTLLFGYISYKTIIGAIEKTSSLGVGFIITVVSVSLILPAAILIYQYKNK